MYEAPTIISTCMNCIAPGSLLATFIMTVVGIAIAVGAERRKTTTTLQPLNLLKPFNGASQILVVQHGNQSVGRFFSIARSRSRYSMICLRSATSE